MRYLNTAIRIEAERSAVWSVLADFPRYGEWNPMLRRMDGSLSPGTRVKLLIKLLPFLPPFPLQATVEAVERDRSFYWIGKLISSKIFQGEHHFKLVSDHAGGTVFEQGENYSGAFSFLSVLAMPVLRRGFERMNEALKSAVEAKQSTRKAGSAVASPQKGVTV